MLVFKASIVLDIKFLRAAQVYLSQSKFGKAVNFSHSREPSTLVMCIGSVTLRDMREISQRHVPKSGGTGGRGATCILTRKIENNQGFLRANGTIQGSSEFLWYGVVRYRDETFYGRVQRDRGSIGLWLGTNCTVLFAYRTVQSPENNPFFC